MYIKNTILNQGKSRIVDIVSFYLRFFMHLTLGSSRFRTYLCPRSPGCRRWPLCWTTWGSSPTIASRWRRSRLPETESSRTSSAAPPTLTVRATHRYLWLDGGIALASTPQDSKASHRLVSWWMCQKSKHCKCKVAAAKSCHFLPHLFKKYILNLSKSI